MRRFIKTYVVRRHVQFTVVQDGETREFSVQRWAAVDACPETIETFRYEAGDLGVGLELARGKAIAFASKLAEAEKAGRSAQEGQTR